MPLRLCRECGQGVSTEADTCPHCGAGDPGGEKAIAARRSMIFGAGLLGFIIVAASLSGGADPAPPSAPRDQNTAENASSMCMVFVERNLKAPATAKFDYSADQASRVDSTTWESSGVVDAENSFGAMLRNRYYCKLQYNRGRDTWTPLSVRID
jgi:hypothetical protein